MRENTNHRVQPKTLDMASLECLREFEEHLNQTGFSRRFIATCIGAARHLLVWLELDGSEVKAVDNAAIRRFRDHKCTCPPREGRTGLYTLNAPPPRHTMNGVHWFIRFLEESGRIAHPGELERGQQLLDRAEPPEAKRSHINVSQFSRHFCYFRILIAHPCRMLTAEASGLEIRQFHFFFSL